MEPYALTSWVTDLPPKIAVEVIVDTFGYYLMYNSVLQHLFISYKG